MLFVGIAGATCSGKGYLSQHLQERLSKQACTIISMDAYYKDLSQIDEDLRDANNFDIPEALDFDLLQKHLKALVAGEAVNLPSYDFRTHTRKQTVTRIWPTKGSTIIIEGLFALYWTEIRQILSTKVFIDVDHRTCLRRRIERDIHNRERTINSVMEQFEKIVLPMYERHIVQTRIYADVIIQGTDPIEKSIEIVCRTMRENSSKTQTHQSINITESDF